jgi:hypothetical protein
MAGDAANRLPADPVSAGALNPQIAAMPREELERLLSDFGVDPSGLKTRHHLLAALAERKQLIAGMDRDALVDVLRWAKKDVSASATLEQLAVEVARLKTMRFEGLGRRGLLCLAQLRGVKARPDASEAWLIRQMKRQENFFARLNRKRRAWIAGLVSGALGESDAADPAPAAVESERAPDVQPPAPRPATIKDDIEEGGLFGGIASRVKRTADSYLNQKLDEIEARIDRKLDEIDRRMAEWRDKEIANRLRILKITLWASVVVAAFSLLYLYVKVYFAS